MRGVFLSLVLLCSFSLAAQSYFSVEQADGMLRGHQAKLSEFHLKLLAREAPKGGYASRWKALLKEVQTLEGIMACADADWFYGQFEPQVYRVQESVADPEVFFTELTKLVALTSYRFEAIAERYAQRGCAEDGVQAAVQRGRSHAERPRPELKGIAPGSN
jgi:hypothetical protein